MQIDPAKLTPRDRYRWVTSTIVPRPIAWVCTRSASGVHNLAPHSFYTVACVSPPVVQFTSVGRKDSLRNAEATGEFTVNLTRKYGFADPVTVGIALPKGTKGLTIAKLTIAKGQATGKFTITATDKATVGDLALNVEATLKLQGQTIKVTQPLKLKVIEVKKEAKKK